MVTKRVEMNGTTEFSRSIGMSPALCAAFQLQQDDVVYVTAGTKRTRATVRCINKSDNDVLIGHHIRRYLALPRRLHIHIKQNSQYDLELGPFFGILARIIPRSVPYGEQNRDFRLHMALGKKQHVPVYCFGPSDVRWKSRIIRARVYDEQRRRWIRRFMPLPNVVWNRSYWPGKHQRSRMRRTMHGLWRRGSRPFNPGVGTKWQVYRLLLADESLRAHVPHTEQYRSPRTVLRMLQRYKRVYMKPLWGGWGIGIMRLQRISRGRYRLTRTIGRRGRTWSRVTGPAQMRAIVRRLVDGPYLIQQEIPLARINNRVTDVRVLAQRRGDGEWDVTGAVMRVGKPRSVISNLHGGGKAYKLRDALNIIFADKPEMVNKTMQRLQSLSIAIARRVESRYGRFGEIGLDFGVDRTGHIWFIEVNSRPGRHSFRTTSPDDVWLASSEFPIAYATHLAQFSTGDGIKQ